MAFYAWRLSQIKHIDVTIVDAKVDEKSPFFFKSAQLGSSQFNPTQTFRSLKQIPTSSKYDVVILSCNSLQNFQSTCSGLNNIVKPNTLVLVESTGYINLEPFVSTSFSTASAVCVMSIMNESDVRKVSTNHFYHKVRGNDTRIYFGTSSGLASKLTSNPNYQKVYKLLQSISENSNGSISLLKSGNIKEFMTYQWKLALPRIVFSPMMVLFEIEFPELLQNQILTKPLITGLINELFKLIKKMDCKLVKGFENEANLLKSWVKIFPETKSNESFINSPTLFYNYYKRYDLELDLLLLQPILLSDDSGLRTPYLENLYSMMCQFSKINTDSALFFQRKTSEGPDVTSLSLTAKQLEAEIQTKSKREQELVQSIQNLEVSKISIENDVFKLETNLKTLQQDIVNMENKFSKLQYEFENKSKSLEYEHEAKHKALSEEYNQKLRQLEDQFLKQKLQNNSPESLPTQQPSIPAPSSARNNSNAYNNRDSVMTLDGLADLSHIVQYSNALSEEDQQKQMANQKPPTIAEQHSGSAPSHSNSHSLAHPNAHANPPVAQTSAQTPGEFVDAVDMPPHLLEKELELKRREEALLAREQQRNGSVGYNEYDQSQYNGSQQQLQQYQQGQRPPQLPQQPQNQAFPAQQYGYSQQAPPFPLKQQRLQQQYYNQQPQNYPPAPNGYADQQPPHGLPSGGMPPNQFPPNLKLNGSFTNMQYYKQSVPQLNGYGQPQQPQPFQQLKQPAQPRRLSSMPGGMSNYKDYQQQYKQPPPSQQQQQQLFGNSASFNNAAPIDPFIEGRFKPNAKKNARKSAMPQFNGNLDGLDMGGRGGMPLPGARKSVSMANQMNSSPNHTRQSSSNMLLSQNHPNGAPAAQLQLQLQLQPPSNHQQNPSSSNYLQPPHMNSSSSSTNTNDTPLTSNESAEQQQIHLQVPTQQQQQQNLHQNVSQGYNDSNAKPLGGIADSNKGGADGNSTGKKKKGLFGRKK